MLLLLWLAWPAWQEARAETVLENLDYLVDGLMSKELARIHITLKNTGPGRYYADFLGEPKGLLKVLKGNRREFYQTEMVMREGRLMPVVYREETWKSGKRSLNEYRFDYEQNRVELWQKKDDKDPLERKWEAALTGPIYDYLSAFYNCRLGYVGEMKEGETIKLKSIPYPKNEEIEVRVGQDSKEGRKIMVAVNNPGFKSWKGMIYGYLDGKMVVQQAWSPVLIFGQVTAHLQPGSKTLEKGLPETKGP